MKATLIFLSMLLLLNGLNSIGVKKIKSKASADGKIFITCDNTLTKITINGESITLNSGGETNWQITKQYSASLTAGDTVEIFGSNAGAQVGFLATIQYVDAAGNSQEVSTGTDWTCGGVTPTTFGANGVSPWGTISSISSSAIWIWNSAAQVVGDATSCKIVLPGVVPTLSNDWSAILTWGATVRDLDLFALLPSGSKVYYRNKQSGNVTLDLDDRDGAGPETLNFNTIESGSYQVWVHDYTREAPITQSEAQVAVYRGENLVETFTVTTSGAGNELWWHVCDINADSGSLETVNTVSTAFRG